MTTLTLVAECYHAEYEELDMPILSQSQILLDLLFLLEGIAFFMMDSCVKKKANKFNLCAMMGGW